MRPVAPGVERLLRRLAGRERQRVERAVVVAAGGVGALVEDVGVELAPRDLGAVGLDRLRPAPGEVGEHRPRVDLPVLEVHRHAGGARLVGPVAVGRVVRDGAVQELLPTRVRGVLACLGEVGVDATRRRGSCTAPFTDGFCHSRVSASVSAGLRQPCWAHARRNGVNTLNGSPSSLRTRPGATAYGRAGAHQLPLVLGQRLRHGLVALAAVGPEVGGDVHRRGVDGLRDLGHHLGGVAAHDEQPPAERRVQRPQRPVEVGAPGRARRVEQGGVEHEQGECGRRGVAGGEERRLVAHPQVAAEPDEGRVAHGRRR